MLIDETDGRVKICDFGSAKQLKKEKKVLLIYVQDITEHRN